MLVFLNDRIIPEAEAVVSVFDRGFLYGDGLFEAVRIYNGKPFLWDLHIARWEEGCRLLQILPPLSPLQVRTALEELLRQNQLREAIARIHLSRGMGPRGYSPKDAHSPTVVISLHPIAKTDSHKPKLLKAVTSKFVLHERDPLAVAKHANKLLNVLARAEADAAGADEALLLNDRGYIVEGTSSNLFWIVSNTLITPPVRSGILPGTTRRFLLDLARQLSIEVAERDMIPSELVRADGVFLTSCSREVAELSHIDGQALARSPLVLRLFKAYRSAARKSLPEK